MNENELIPHLFRTEYRKIISVLCKLFGIAHIETAEDIVSDTFLAASETWAQKGLPKNPIAWLYNVSKNKAINRLKHDRLLWEKIALEIKQNGATLQDTDIDLSNENFVDSQLQMMFAVCHPCISVESQIGLSLSILCGFGVTEIADAFLTNTETIYKRLARAKEKLRAEKVKIEIPMQSAIDKRLETVLTTLYLLFSEGYYSTSQNLILRKELCFEAMRLNLMLVENQRTNTPSANALLSLMCFHSSRFEARIDGRGEIILYEEQNEDLWDDELIAKGNYFFTHASKGNQLTKYHLEAAIAFWHTQKKDPEKKWEYILQLYNQLLQIEYSPVAALNRTYAFSKANGRAAAIIEAEKLNLADNHFYFTLLGELYKGMDNDKATEYFQKAISLAHTQAEKQTIQKKIDKIK